MRKIAICALLLLFFPCFLLQAQVCSVDSSFTAPGIYPGDTLPVMTANLPYEEVVQFVFPPDTVINNNTLPFDSFVVNTIDRLPTWLDWECNNNHPVCTYVSTPGELTRGCVRIFGTAPTTAVNAPAYDSIIVTGTAWVTILFPVPIAQTIPVYYQVRDTLVGLTDPLHSELGLQVLPNPGTGRAWVHFTLPGKSRLRLRMLALDGREVYRQNWGAYSAGKQQIQLQLADELARGLYFIRLETEDGPAATTKFWLK